MSSALAFSAPFSAPNDVIGAPTASILRPLDTLAGRDPAEAPGVLGSALQALAPADAGAILETLAAQTAALSLILAADASGAITLPASLRDLAQAATTLPGFLGGV